MDFYIDIETIPSAVPPEVIYPAEPDYENIQADPRLKDPQKITDNIAMKTEKAREKYTEDCQKAEADAQAAWRKESLQPLKGRILCIGIALDDNDAFTIYAETERPMIEELERVVKDACGNLRPTWIGHNVAGFDLQWIKLRALKYGCFSLVSYIDLRRYHGNFVDTMDEVGTWQDKYRLDDLCKYFDLGTKTEGIDGSKVFDFWQAGRIDEIRRYCEQDVELARALYYRLSAAA